MILLDSNLNKEVVMHVDFTSDTPASPQELNGMFIKVGRFFNFKIQQRFC